jgi:hypothetical protein
MKPPRLTAMVLFALLSGAALAQTSTSFKITLVSIGNSVVATGLGSGSYGLDAGFDAAYLPPGEVGDVLLTDKQTLVWSGEPSAAAYNLYRDDTGDGYGTCEERNIASTTTIDASIPTMNNVFYYLVTVKNRLAEEGTKGFQGAGVERLGAHDLSVCP